MDLEWTLVEYRPGRYAKVAKDGEFVGMASEAEIRAWFSQFEPSSGKGGQVRSDPRPPISRAVQKTTPETDTNWGAPILWGRQPDFRRAGGGIPESLSTASSSDVDHAAPGPTGPEAEEPGGEVQAAKTQSQVDWSKPFLWGPPAATPDGTDPRQEQALEHPDGAGGQTAKVDVEDEILGEEAAEAHLEPIPSVADSPDVGKDDEEHHADAPELETAAAVATIQDGDEVGEDVRTAESHTEVSDSRAVAVSSEGQAPARQRIEADADTAAGEPVSAQNNASKPAIISSQLNLFDPAALLSAGNRLETSSEPEGASERALSISAPITPQDTGVEEAQESEQAARTFETTLKNEDLQESEVPGADPKGEGADLATNEPTAGAAAQLPSPTPDPHDGEPQRMDPESVTKAAEALTSKRMASAEEEGVIGLPVGPEPEDGALDGDEIEDELEPVTLGGGTFQPGDTTAARKLPAEEIEEVYFEPGVTDAEGQWLWVDPRYESGYSPLAFDLAEFLDRATKLFQTKSWTRGKKPARLAVRPDQIDQDEQESNGLKSVAESAGLEVVYDARVPPGTYWLGLATDKKGH